MAHTSLALVAAGWAFQGYAAKQEATPEIRYTDLYALLDQGKWTRSRCAAFRSTATQGDRDGRRASSHDVPNAPPGDGGPGDPTAAT